MSDLVLDQLTQGKPVLIEKNGKSICVARVGDEVFAIDDKSRDALDFFVDRGLTHLRYHALDGKAVDHAIKSLGINTIGQEEGADIGFLAEIAVLDLGHLEQQRQQLLFFAQRYGYGVGAAVVWANVTANEIDMVTLNADLFAQCFLELGDSRFKGVAVGAEDREKLAHFRGGCGHLADYAVVLALFVVRRVDQQWQQ